MYPIAALTFANIFVIEKLGITYWYRKPPAYGPELNDTALEWMKWAPITFFGLGYWIMGNKQMFNNYTKATTYKTDPIITGHNGLPWNEDGPALVMFFFFIIFLSVGCFGAQFIMFLRHHGCLEQQFDEVEIDECLGNYFECIPDNLRRDWLTTEVYNRNVLGIHTFGIGTFEELRTVHGKSKTLQG